MKWLLCYWRISCECRNFYFFFLKRWNCKLGHSAVCLPHVGGDRMRTLIVQMKMPHSSLPSDSEMEKNKSQGQKIVTFWTSCQAASKEACPDDFCVREASYLSDCIHFKCAFIKLVRDRRKDAYFLGEERVCTFSFAGSLHSSKLVGWGSRNRLRIMVPEGVHG